jgi:hypothetical protein
MVEIYTGPAPLAQMLREELLERGVGAELRAADPLGAIYGSTAAPPLLQSVLVAPEAAEQQRLEIDEVLALVSEPDPEADQEN